MQSARTEPAYACLLASPVGKSTLKQVPCNSMPCSCSLLCARVCAGGPDARLQAPWYAARDNYQTVMRCNAWPCSRNLYAPANPRSVTYASAAERDAAAPALKAQADVEWALDEQLMQVGVRFSWQSGQGRGFVLSTFASGVNVLPHASNAVASLSFNPHHDCTPCCSSCYVCCCHRRCCCSCTPRAWACSSSCVQLSPKTTCWTTWRVGMP